MIWARRQGWNWFAYAGFFFFLILSVTTLPFVGILVILPHTESYFHFSVQQNDKVGNATISKNVADGYIRLSGVGGLSVDNKLTLELRMVLYRNSTATSPVNRSLINNPTSIEFSPQYAEEYTRSVDLKHPPKPFHLVLNASNKWDASSDNVEFFVSGKQGIHLVFFNESTTPTQFLPIKMDDVLQVSDESVTVTAINDEYTLSFSFLVIALICLELRGEKKRKCKGDSTEDKKCDEQVSKDDDKGIKTTKNQKHGKQE